MTTPSSVPNDTPVVPGDDAADVARGDVSASAADAVLADVLLRLDRLEVVAAELDARLDADPHAEPEQDLDTDAGA